MTEMALLNVQRAITQKVDKPELRFMCYASRLIVLYICVTFHQTIWNAFRLTERTWAYSRNGYCQYLLCSKGYNSKSRLTRVTFFMFCTLSHGALHSSEKFHYNIERTGAFSRTDYFHHSTMFKGQQLQK